MHKLRSVDVSMAFGDFKVLEGINLDVVPGEVIGVLGPNGAGKTTFMNILTGAYLPTGGRVYLMGEDVNRSYLSMWADTQPCRDIYTHPNFIQFAKKVGMYDAWERFGWPDRFHGKLDKLTAGLPRRICLPPPGGQEGIRTLETR